MPKALRTAAGIAVCLAAFQGAASAEEPIISPERLRMAQKEAELKAVALQKDARAALGVAGIGSSSPWNSVQQNSLEPFIMRWYARAVAALTALPSIDEAGVAGCAAGDPADDRGSRNLPCRSVQPVNFRFACFGLVVARPIE